MPFLSRLFRAFLIYRTAIKHPRTSSAVKWLPIASLIYLFWPIDLVPDLVPLLGQLDDIGIIALLLTIAWKLIPAEFKRAMGNVGTRQNQRNGGAFWENLSRRSASTKPHSENGKPIIDVEPR